MDQVRYVMEIIKEVLLIKYNALLSPIQILNLIIKINANQCNYNI